ncbi:LOW QUALITY PROTEIN: hypothetical protein V1477_000785 [Vespula maculifrons]|uniref:Uncharacterized protein n=1 Tax=Vespula maculifrons TaxID=7453 RepID=A0ABD2CZW9_VESMC
MYVPYIKSNFGYFVIHKSSTNLQILVHVRALKAKLRKRKTRFVERTKVHCFINVYLDVYCLYEFRLDIIGMFYIDHYYTILYHMTNS